MISPIGQRETTRPEVHDERQRASDNRQIREREADRRAKSAAESHAMEQAMSDLDTKAISAAIAGFLACHVLTCRFLVKEGVIDRDRFIAYLEAAREDMRPGIEDPRSLFPL